MFAVIFDVYPKPERHDDYLALAGMLRPDLETIDGFLSVERFADRGRPGWILSVSFWRDEAALVRWRTHGRHREAQERGRHEIFQDYRLRVGRVVADAIAGQAEHRPDRRAADDDRHAQPSTVIALLEVEPEQPEEGAQIDLAGHTGVGVEGLDGFLGSDQFDSIYVQGKVLSRSSWRDETAVRAWQARVLEHETGRALAGGPTVRLRVVAIERDYGMFERAQAPRVEANMSASSLRSWETLARREVADSRPWLRLWAEDVQLPDGRVVEGFFTIEMPDYAVVVALTVDGRVVVERNYKHGPRRVCLNLPAGYVEPGEEPLAAARRELLEETGYVAEEWMSLGGFTNDGNRGCGMGHLFLARQAHKVADPDAGDLEEMEIGLMSLDEVIEAVRRGDVAVLSMAAAIGLAVAAQSAG